MENSNLSRKPAVPPKNLANLTRGTSMVALETNIDEVLQNIVKSEVGASVDNLASLGDYSYGSLQNSVNRKDNVSRSSTYSVQALPPVDNENDNLFVPESTSTLSLLAPDGYNEVENGYAVGLNDVVEITFETPKSPKEAFYVNLVSQNSMRIEPSPERTLELPKHRGRKGNDSASSDVSGVSDAAQKSHSAATTPVDDSNRTGAYDVDGREGSAESFKRAGQPEIVEKLDRFFGESKPGYTDLETSIYKQLVLGNRQQTSASSQALAVDAATKLKKSSAWSLSSKIVATIQTPQPSQLKVLKKIAGVDREPSMPKNKEPGTWRGKVARRRYRHQIVNPTSGELGDDNVASLTFGVPLDVCATSTRSELVPLIIEVCVEIVERLATETQGIYRVPGHSASVNELIEEVNSRADPECIVTENERWNDVNVVASLLKLFFRKLPEALSTDRLYESFITAMRLTNQEKSSLKLKRLLRDLPAQNYATLRYLVQHLNRIAQHHATNKMDAHNLAIMFGPSLFRPIDESMTNMVRDIEDQSGIVERLIRHVDWYFGEWTSDTCIPITPESSEGTAAVGSSNLQLLASAESLFSVLKGADSVDEATMAAGNLGEESSSGGGGFFHLGSGRLSRKHKKVSKDAKDESSGGVDLNRDVELRLVFESSPTRDSGGKPGYSSPALTKVDLARKVSMSITGNRKVKRRFTEKPEVKVTRERVAVTHESPAWKEEKSWQYREDESVGVAKKKEVGPEPVVEVKRYPAYNFVDTTIKRQNTGASKNRVELEEVCRTHAVPSMVAHSSSTVSYPTRPRTQVIGQTITASNREIWSLKQELEEEGCRAEAKEDEVFNQATSSVPPAGMSAASACAVQHRFKTAAAPNRFKRYSETDATKYAAQIVDGHAFDVPPPVNTKMSQGIGKKANHYDVVIRFPEGRKYYVLETSRPSLFFGRSDLATDGRDGVVKSARAAVSERLAGNQVRMLRAERSDVALRSMRNNGAENDDIELRQLISVP